MKKRILLVTDDVDTSTVLHTLLEPRHVIHACRSCSEAVAVAAEHDVSLLVVATAIINSSGCTLLQDLRKHKADLPCIVITDYACVPEAVSAIKAGADDYLIKPLQPNVALDMIYRLTGNAAGKTGMVVEDPRSLELLEIARKVARCNVSVMISGESGTGKEVYSRYIHSHSSRAARPFVAINCAAIPETMLESILFGFEKGSFTGASAARAGKFEQANGGTLLLDEISEMDLGLQAKLLRVIQEKEVERLGSSKPLPLDVRIVATTNRDLKAEVANGRFREDLFYRLNVFPLHLLPLRERRADIVPLAQRFVETFQSSNIVIDSAAATALMQHAWPGNVRELENVIQRALILCDGKVITPAALIFENPAIPNALLIETQTNAPAAVARPSGAERNYLETDLKTREKEIIMGAVASRQSRKEVAEKLGISPRTLRYKLAQFRKEDLALPA